MSPSAEKSNSRDVNWLMVIINLQLFVSSLCGLHFIVLSGFYTTTALAILLITLSLIGVTAGAHRLWAHHTYEATTGLKVFLMICHSLSGQRSIYSWVQLHRLHHKYFKTDLDPYNPKKGFVYSQFVSSNLALSPRQQELLKEIDMSDLEKDKIVMFQYKYYWFIIAIFTLLLPINAPVEYWGETILNSFFIVGWFRLGVVQFMSLLIHSATNVFNIEGDEKDAFNSNMVFLINKSYWLSYHYLVPYDYQCGEFGKYGTDCTSKFIRVCAALELASDLKTLNSQQVREALEIYAVEKKPIADCLDLVKDKDKLPMDHFLTPSKYIPVH